MQSDPIADLLTRLRNASRVGLSQIELPASKQKIELTKLLQREGYIRSYELRDDKDRKCQYLRIIMKYDELGEPVIRKIDRVSKPGLRKYCRVDNLPRILGGAGITVVSTNQGLLSDREARKKRAGGEVLCTVH